MAAPEQSNQTLVDFFKKQNVPEDDVSGLFNNLLLPVPSKNHFFTTSDNGAMVFVNPAGVVVRLSVPEREPLDGNYKFKVDHIDHPAVLKPLGSFRYGKLQVDIMPGVKLGTDYGAIGALHHKLAADGYDFWDSRTIGNLGYLPVKTTEYPDGIPVVIDRNSVHRKPDFDHTQPLRIDEPYHHLQAFYDSLPKFADAWPDVSQPSDPAKVSVFWNAARAKMQEGALQTGWMDGTYTDIFPYYAAHAETSRAQRVSKRYEPVLRGYWQSHGDVDIKPSEGWALKA